MSEMVRCCLCFSLIMEQDHYIDAGSQRWDMHKRCWLNDWVEAVSAGKRLPTLAEFRIAETIDSNVFWRLGEGHIQNLLDAAIEQIEEYEGASDE